MHNFTEKHNKMAGYLQELYRKHRELDNEIKVCYSKREDELVINRLKTKKLWFKDEIHRIEKELKEL
jgi:hypothetical protein